MKVTRQEGNMATLTYEKEMTALLVVDPYNDFISEGGKICGSASRPSRRR
jgi:hypothetical protein